MTPYDHIGIDDVVVVTMLVLVNVEVGPSTVETEETVVTGPAAVEVTVLSCVMVLTIVVVVLAVIVVVALGVGAVTE